MKFNELVKIDASFQNSINIGLDLGDEKKINSYIPTSTGMDFLNHFISNIIEENGDHSTMLIAPYGKGKSHSVLVLISLLEQTNYDQYAKLINKIKISDPELFSLISKIKSRKYLPVILSNTRGTLNQSLMLALQKSLDRANINDIVLDTDFKLVLNRINEWKSNYPDTYSTFKIELTQRKLSEEKFINKIRNYDESALVLFKKIHKKILSGAEFISQNSIEVIDYYQQVCEKLMSSHNYDGMYIVFDEFSKFLESRDEKTISNDMKIIQDLAEVCNNSRSSEMYLQLILHKPINDYLTIDKRIKNSFKGIEGRVTSYYFTSTLRNSFDLISNVLVKKSKYTDYRSSCTSLYTLVKKNIGQLPPFYAELNAEYVQNELIDACYPLHPLTVYLLVKINEKVAQNERTLFTFLAKKSSYSLPNLIEKECEDPFIMPYTIFDYFKNQLIEEKDNIEIHKIASSAVTALKNVENEKESQFIKTLALLLIINEKDALPTNLSVLSASLTLDHDACEEILDNLISKSILVQRHSGQIQFKINMDLNLSKSVDNIVNTKLSNVHVEKELNEILDKKYFYPRTYNIINSITRFFKIEYILEKDFLAIKNADIYFEKNEIDGLILNVVRDEEGNYDAIFDHVKEIQNDRLVVVYPKEYNEYSQLIKKYLATNTLINDKEFTENNLLVKNELELLLEDAKNAIIELTEKDYSFSSEYNYICCTFNNFELNESKRNLSKNRILGNVLSSVYSQYPNNINLELLNKNNVKSTYKSAREKVVEKILNNTLSIENLGTSPEDTIVNCILIETGIVNNKTTDKMNDVFTVIERFLSVENESFKPLYDKLMAPPYGIRKGIIPLFLALVISRLQQCLLLSYKTQEVELNAKTIELINEEPQNYCYTLDEINASKLKYLDDLSSLFNCELSRDTTKNYVILANAIRTWFISLPKYTRQMIGKDSNIRSIEYKKLKKQLSQNNINSSELILFSIPKIVDTNELDKTIEKLSEIKIKLDLYIDEYLFVLKKEINSKLGFDEDTTLTHSLHYWVTRNEEVLNQKVLESSIKDFIYECKNAIEGKEMFLINKIAFSLTGFFIDDWSEETHNIFTDQLEKINELAKTDEEVENKSNSVTLNYDGETIVKYFDDEDEGYFELVEEYICNVMEDYGDLLSNEQKISLLAKIMKKYF